MIAAVYFGVGVERIKESVATTQISPGDLTRFTLATALANPVDGTPFPGGSYDGTLRDDWEFVPGAGDLDQCKGADWGEGYAY